MRLPVTVIVLLLALPRPASALSCAAFHVRLMLPEAGLKAPPTTRPIVEVVSIEGDPLKEIKLWLVGAGDRRVAASQRIVGQAQVRAVQLTPARPLAAGRYEVRWSRAGYSATAGAFEVAADARPHAPSPPVLLGNFFEGEVKSAWEPKPRHVRYLQLTSVQKNPRGAVLAVWIDRTALDYAKPPLLITDQPSPIILGQSPGACPIDRYVVPGGKGKLRVGLKAIDSAGNPGKPVELTINLGR